MESVVGSAADFFLTADPTDFDIQWRNFECALYAMQCDMGKIPNQYQAPKLGVAKLLKQLQLSDGVSLSLTTNVYFAKSNGAGKPSLIDVSSARAPSRGRVHRTSATQHT
jgi:hypothetical protein